MGSLLGGGAQTSTSTSVQKLSPEQKELMALVIPQATEFVENPPELFPGTAIAGPDPLQTQAQQQVISTVGTDGTVPQIAGASFDALQGLFAGNFQDPGVAAAQGFMLDPNFLVNNPHMEAALRAATDPLTAAFEQTILPNIGSEAQSVGQVGSSRQGIAEGIASEALLRQIGATGASFSNQAFRDAMQAQLQALGIGAAREQTGLSATLEGLEAAPAVAGLQFAGPQALEAVGTQRQMLAQSRLSEEAQRFISEQLIPFSAAQDVAALAFGMPGGQTSTTGTAPGATQSIGSTLMGIASIASLFVTPSDRRLKKDLTFLGKSPSGIPKYSFRYILDPLQRLWRGALAQDLLRMGRPDAVAIDEPSGYYTVDYSKIDVVFGRIY